MTHALGHRSRVKVVFWPTCRPGNNCNTKSNCHPEKTASVSLFRFGALVPFSISVAEQLGSLVQILCKNVILEVSPLLPCNFLETSR